MGEWYYIGHYGQLGPLTRDQIEELVQGGVIGRETYVWRAGMNDWLRADMVSDLQMIFGAMQPTTPPPPPLTDHAPAPTTNYGMDLARSPFQPAIAGPGLYPRSFTPLKSDRSRTLAGVLQLIVPGVGRIYMGFAAIGVLQLFLALCGVGWVWSIVDGIIILGGGVKMDGYGRQMQD